MNTPPIVHAGRDTISARNLRCLSALRDRFETLESLSESVDIRDLAQSKMPDFCRLGTLAKAGLDEGSPCVLIRGLPLPSFHPREEELLLLLIGSALGKPQPTGGAEKRMVWEVKPRAARENYTPTLSETCGAAFLHLDSAYKKMPERVVMLYCRKPALNRNSGVTLILDGSRVVSDLSRTQEGIRCKEILSRVELGFEVPTVFRALQDEARPEWMFGRVLDDGMIRFRADLIRHGFDLGISSDPDARWAVDFFCRHLAAMDPQMVRLEEGDLLIVPNHRSFHGRTAIGSDRQRVLLRLRLN